MLHIYKYIIGALSLCGLISVSSCSLPREGQCGATDFVTVRDGKFYQGEDEYRFVGTNFWYGAILASEGRGGNRDRLQKELDLMQSVGIDNVRVLVGGDGREGIPSHINPKLQTEPGVYNDTLLQGLDYLMAELEKRQMKAVLFLNNAWEWSGGYGAYLDWVGFSADVYSSKEYGKMVHFDRTPVPSLEGWWEYMQYVSNFVVNDSAKTLANNHLKFIVSRTNTITGKPYSESKALMSWEIANEPRCFADDSLHKAKFVEWIDEQSRMIKAIDPNHLVTTGSEGYHGCQDDMELFKAIHTLPNIDYACIHIWPNNWGWLGQFNQNYDADKTIDANAKDPIVERVQAACDSTLAYINAAYKALAEANGIPGSESRCGTPIVLEEFGYPRDRFLFTPGSSTEGRDAYYKYVFNIIRTTGQINGCNFWGWGGLADVKHTIWEPYDDYVCDPAQEEQGLNSVFACDSSTMQMIQEINLEPTCTTLVANDSDWVWYGEDPFSIDIPITNLANKSQAVDSIIVKIYTDRDELTNVISDRNPELTIPYTVRFENIKFPNVPGFYHIKVEVNGKNIVRNSTEVYGNKMPIDFFAIGYEPEKIVSVPDPQPDFQAFWDEARAQLAKTPINAKVTELKDQKGEKRAYNAIIQGLDGAPVQVYYTVPTKPGKYPVHIINMGYSSKPWPLDLTDNGWIDVIVSSRGQGSNEEISNPYGKWIQYGLDSPKHFYYRGAYLDCPRAIDYLVTLPEVDADNIFLEGGSQGGAYSMSCAALDHRVRAVACYITFMSDFPDYFKIAAWPGNEIMGRQKELGLSDEELYKTLSYFDIKNLAQWIECPVYMAVGLQDITCPTHTNFAGYNQVKTEKQYHIYRNYGHHVDYSHWTPTMYEFYERHKSSK